MLLFLEAICTDLTGPIKPDHLMGLSQMSQLQILQILHSFSPRTSFSLLYMLLLAAMLSSSDGCLILLKDFLSLWLSCHRVHLPFFIDMSLVKIPLIILDTLNMKINMTPPNSETFLRSLEWPCCLLRLSHKSFNS